MSLDNGIYQICFVGLDVQSSGLYATGHTIDAPVLAQALNPSASLEQHWKVEAVVGKQNTYTISYTSASRPGLSIIIDHRGPSQPVKLNVDVAEWVITPVESELSGVYRILQPSNGMLGAKRAVTQEAGQLLVKSYPVIRNMPPLPQWQFVEAAQ